MITYDSKVAPDTKLRELYVYADATPSQYVNVSEGLLDVGGSFLYVAPSLDQVGITPATQYYQKLSIVQSDGSGNITVLDGAEVNALAPGYSESGGSPVTTTPGGNIDILLDYDMSIVFNMPGSLGSIVPFGIAYDNAGFMWVTDGQGYSIMKVAVSDGSITYYGNGFFPNQPSQYAIVYDNAGNMWVSSASSGDMYVVQVSTGTLIATYNYGGGIYNIAFDGTYLWGITGGAFKQINVSDGSLVGTYSTEVGANPVYDGFYICFDGTNMWATGYTGIASINVSTLSVSTFATMLGGAAPITYDGVSFVWATVGNQMASIDTVTGVQTFYSVPTIGNYGGLSVLVPSTGDLWVFGANNGTVNKFTPSTQAYRYFPNVISATYSGGASFDGTNLWFASQQYPFAVIEVFPPGYQVVTIGAYSDASDIASAIQSAVQALTPINPANAAAYTGFTAAWNGTEYVLTSGVTGPQSAVTVTVDPTNDISASLQLGIPNGGTEVIGTSAVTPEYPALAAGNTLLAYLFTPASPITDSTSVVANSDINNDVQER